jgi:hypothetical protein
VIAYRAMPDVPGELVARPAGLLRGERRRRGTRRHARALSCWKQALLGLVWFRKNEEMTALAAGFGISRATGYLEIKERVADALIARADHAVPGLADAIRVREAATPLTNAHYTRNPRGAVEGYDNSPANSGLGCLPPQTRSPTSSSPEHGRRPGE